MKSIISILISILIYGSGPIILGILAGHPFIGILISAILVISLYGVSILSQFKGAEMALSQPPKIGETWVELKVNGHVFWKGEKFDFQPTLTSIEERSSIEINPFRNKGGRPKGSLSAGNLTIGTRIEDIVPFLREAKQARDLEMVALPSFAKKGAIANQPFEIG